MKKYFWPILILIVLAGAYLRLVKLESIPPHLGNDEISIAFDSYSVRTIGKDEHGHWWPISFESHRTYKAPLYAYLNMPLNYLLGNTEWGVRMLSAVAGTVSILLTGMIGAAMAGPGVGIMAAMLMAIDPKNIFVSRIAYESNLATMVMLLGIWMMVNYVKNKKKISLIGYGLMMGLSIWAYHTEWGLVPMLMMATAYIFREKIKIKTWLVAIGLMLVVAAPVFYNFVAVQRNDPNNRASSQMWFGDGQYKDYLKNSSDNVVKKSVKTLMLPLYYYIQHFDLQINFSSGMDLFNNRSPLNSGWFFLATIPMLIYGLIYGSGVYGKWWKFVWVWWLLCPIIPAMTGTVSAVRNLPFIVPTCLIMAGGAKYIWQKSKLWSVIIGIILLLNFGMFGIAYYVHYPKDSGNNFQYGYKQAWEFIKPNINSYDQVVVENRFGLFGQFTGVPHLYFGYFGAFTPEEMQQRVDKDGVRIGKYTFKYVDWNQEVYKPKTVYIVSAVNPGAGIINNNLRQIGVIRNTDNELQFLIYETVEKKVP